jgi:flavin reductase (DIM6/NTAB) family NADH-FMN oxidoreductase RutF
VTPDDGWIAADDPAAYRQGLSCFATGITVVTGETPDGLLFGLTASSFQSVSLEPPLVLYSVRRGAASIALVKRSGRFAVNVLAEDQGELAQRFASPVPDRFAGVDWYLGPYGSPVIGGSLATFECRHWATYDGGDHVIIVGEVEGYRREPSGTPLLFFRGQFRPIGPVFSPA